MEEDDIVKGIAMALYRDKLIKERIASLRSLYSLYEL